MTTNEYHAMVERDKELTVLRDLVKRQDAVINDFLPNVGQCVLQNYGELNNVLLDYTLYKQRYVDKEGDGNG